MMEAARTSETLVDKLFYMAVHARRQIWISEV
jgi:hypothetical protein